MVYCQLLNKTFRYEGDWSGGLRSGAGRYSSKATGGAYEGTYANDLKVYFLELLLNQNVIHLFPVFFFMIKRYVESFKMLQFDFVIRLNNFFVTLKVSVKHAQGPVNFNKPYRSIKPRRFFLVLFVYKTKWPKIFRFSP